MTQTSALRAHCRTPFHHTMVPAVSQQAQLGLVCQCLELLGAPLGEWQSSNATAHQDGNNSRDSLSGPMAQLLLQPGWLMQGAIVKPSPQCKSASYCPQTFLSSGFQCRDDISEFKPTFWDCKSSQSWLLSCITHHMTDSLPCFSMKHHNLSFTTAGL